MLCRLRKLLPEADGIGLPKLTYCEFDLILRVTNITVVTKACESGSGPGWVRVVAINCLQACLSWASLYAFA